MSPSASGLVVDLGANIQRVRSAIDAAAARAGRSAADVTLVCVSKTHPANVVHAACDAGAADFGENRIQEASPKIEALRGAGVTPRWHLVGHLQRNKAREAARLFDILHSVDSERLAVAVNSAADRKIGVLIEVNVAREATKHGILPEDLETLAGLIEGLPNLDLRGLMTVAPQVGDPEEVRPVFRELRLMRDRLGLSELSMGMTDDFEVAVEEGSTLVRVGRAIFGPRGA